MIACDLTGGQALIPGAGLVEARVSLADGLLQSAPVGRAVDASGFLILPGIVDAHGDGFERHVAPRRGAMTDVAEGLRAAEAEMAANGITTGVLAQFLSWEGGLRGAAFADAVFCALRDMAPRPATDLIGQLRFEISLLDDYAGLPDRLAGWGVSYVVFNDHLPHARLSEGRKPPRLVGQALKAGRSPEAHLALMQGLQARFGAVAGALPDLCARLSERGVRMGSHDDRTAEARREWAENGAPIAEFPETAEAAEAGKCHVILGAPNVVRGGSHNGNLSARDIAVAGGCDALASDYHYPSPRRAALRLMTEGMGWEEAWGLVSEGPARVLGLSDRGRIAPGLRADLVVLDAETTRVAATFAGGQVSYLNGRFAARLMG